VVGTTALLICIDMFFVYLTVYDVVTNSSLGIYQHCRRHGHSWPMVGEEPILLPRRDSLIPNPRCLQLYGRPSPCPFVLCPLRVSHMDSILCHTHRYISADCCHTVNHRASLVMFEDDRSHAQVSTFYIVEMSDANNEGLVYGLLTTTANLGSPLGRAIGNQVYRAFSPSLRSLYQVTILIWFSSSAPSAL
jgi:hypothetical protein